MKATAIQNQNVRTAGPNFIAAVAVLPTPSTQLAPSMEDTTSAAIFFERGSNAQ
jgi:hypothetical protein